MFLFTGKYQKLSGSGLDIITSFPVFALVCLTLFIMEISGFHRRVHSHLKILKLSQSGFYDIISGFRFSGQNISRSDYWLSTSYSLPPGAKLCNCLIVIFVLRMQVWFIKHQNTVTDGHIPMLFTI